MEIRKVALTISPSLRKGNPSLIFRRDIIDIHKALKYAGDYVIYPEFADNGRIHYHGTVTLHDQIKWYKYSLPRLHEIGFVCIKNNINEGWEEYIKKNWLITKDVLDINEPIGNEEGEKHTQARKLALKKVRESIQHLDKPEQIINIAEHMLIQ